MSINEGQLYKRGNVAPCFYKVISSAVEEIHPLIKSLIAVIKKLPCVLEDEEGMRLAVYEALANAIRHGNKNDPAKKVVVTCFCEYGSNGNILVVVRDEGSGFDPHAVPDPRTAEMLYASHGRGIFLIRRLMDEVTYTEGGRQLEMRKRLRC